MIASVAIKHRVNSDLLFDYQIPPDIKLEPFSMVEVDFAGRETLAIVVSIKPSSQRQLKDIVKVISKGAVFTNNQIKLAKQISDYFLAPFGPTIFSFFPNLSKREIGNIKPGEVAKRNVISGKSELLIMELDQSLQYFFQTIKPNSQNIVLLPSVNKIEQTQAQMKKIYPHLLIYTWHSKISIRQKRIIYQNCLCGKEMTIIGSRDTVFLPFRSLKNIYIAKPSSFSYFEDQMPRYNAYHVTRLLTEIFSCNLFVAESFPSIISYISYKKNLLSLNISNTNPRFDLYDNYNREMQSPSTQKKIKATLSKAKSILIIGPFKNKLRGTCKTCKSDIVCNKCEGAFFNDKCLCINCNQSAPTVCPGCASRQIAFSGFTKNSILDILPANRDSVRITFSDLENLDDLPPNFDNILVPYFDSMYEFGFIGYKNKLLESICSVSRISSNNVLIFSDKYKNELRHVRSGNWESFVKAQLKERKGEHLPPYTKAIKLISKYNYDKSIKLINKIREELDLNSPVFTIQKKENWTEALFLIAHSHYAKIRNDLKKHITSKVHIVIDPVDFGV